MPKEIFEQYFERDKDGYYSIDALTDESDQFIIYADERPLETLGDKIAFYFSTQWRYPIVAILKLFELAPKNKKTDIDWYCVEENYCYISHFYWQDERIQEEIYYLEDDKEFEQFCHDINEADAWDDPKFNTHDFIWSYILEKRHAWWSIDSEDLLQRYESREAMHMIDEIRQKRIRFTQIKNRDGEIFNFCVDNYVREEDADENTYEWCDISWEIFQNGKWYKSYRSEDMEHPDIDNVRDTLERFINGKLKKRTTLSFAEPYIEFKFIPSDEPECVFWSVSDDGGDELAIHLNIEEAQRLLKYLQKITAKNK